MGEWIFIFIVSMIIPFTMIGFGLIFLYKRPKKIKHLFGYRSRMSMINDDTWKFAHYYIGKLWNILGWILLLLSTGLIIYLYNKDERTQDTIFIILVFVQCLFLLGPILPTEKALRKTFDKEGKFK